MKTEQLKKIMDTAVSFVYPNRCACCGAIIPESDNLCHACAVGIERVGSKICLNCGQEIKFCECGINIYRFRACNAAFYNTGIARKGVYGIKFRGRAPAAAYFAAEMVKVINRDYSDIRFDAVCCVPMYYFDRCRRGYNQSALISKAIAKALKLPHINNALSKRRPTAPQHKTVSASERFENVRGLYYCRRRLNYENVLLVDDIKTTGATLDECARQLMLAGVKNVYCSTALITNMRLKNGRKKDIIKTKGGDANGDGNRN